MEDAHSAAIGRVLQDLLLASYGMYPEGIAGEVAAAARRLGGSDVRLLLADYDQRELVGFDRDDDRSFPIDGPGPGMAFRRERAIAETSPDGGRRLWLPAKDSADRLGVFGVIDDGTVADRHWEAVASLTGELIASKSHVGDHIALRRRRVPFSLAAEMRWSLLPPLTFTSPDVTIAGFLQPSHGIAGDAFDYSVSARTASLAIFDAMGHGMEASRMANVAVGCCRNARRAGADPAAVLRVLDDVITSEFGGSRFVTAQAMALDLDSGELVIANAGHPLPLHLRRGHRPEPIACAPARPAGLGGEPSTTVVHLEQGDGVLFCTDGIVEARSPDGHFFGDERLTALVAEIDDVGPSAEVVRRGLHAVMDYQEGAPRDDATMLLLRRSSEVGPATSP